METTKSLTKENEKLEAKLARLKVKSSAHKKKGAVEAAAARECQEVST
jgi:hypothetical protein